jgi:hypothetical protein
MVSPGDEEGEVYLSVPIVRPNRAGVSYAFTTPLPDIFRLWSSGSDDLEASNEESDQGKKNRTEPDSSPEVTFNAGINGIVRSSEKKVKYMDNGVEKITKVRTSTGYCGCLLIFHLYPGSRPACYHAGSLHLGRQH